MWNSHWCFFLLSLLSPFLFEGYALRICYVGCWVFCTLGLLFHPATFPIAVMASLAVWPESAHQPGTARGLLGKLTRIPFLEFLIQSRVLHPFLKIRSSQGLLWITALEDIHTGSHLSCLFSVLTVLLPSRKCRSSSNGNLMPTGSTHTTREHFLGHFRSPLKFQALVPARRGKESTASLGWWP